MTDRSAVPAHGGRWRVPVLIASGLGSGFSRSAPGTMGSLAALLPGILLSAHTALLLAAIVAACIAGFWAIPRACGGDDHGWVVIDEVAGQWITLLGIPSWLGTHTGLGIHPGHAPWLRLLPWWVAAFAMFRLLDILKPGPIGAMDRRHGAFGVMGDDILAGLLGAALLGLAQFLIAAS